MRWKQILKREMDVEFFACVHGASMILIYGFLEWLFGGREVSFFTILWMLILGYLIAWIQKILFLKEKVYRKREYRVRNILWCVLPMAAMVIFEKIFSWFLEEQHMEELLFYLIMAAYFIMLKWFLIYFYEEDTKEMNRLLEKRLKREEEIR